jgi:hypothetical protein
MQEKFNQPAFYAKEIARLVGYGCSSNMVGIIANRIGLKTDLNGYYVRDAVATKGGLRHYDTFKYYIHVVDIIREEFFLKHKKLG